MTSKSQQWIDRLWSASVIISGLLLLLALLPGFHDAKDGEFRMTCTWASLPFSLVAALANKPAAKLAAWFCLSTAVVAGWVALMRF